MAYEDYYETVQEIYLAYYGRAADQEGLAYWSVLLDQEDGNLDNIIQAFATSPESQERYGALSNREKISAIYQSLYDRGPDPGGLSFYLDQLEQGKMTQATIMLNILDGSRGADLARIDRLVDSAMNQIDSGQLERLASEYGSQREPDAAQPGTLSLSDGRVYEVVVGTNGADTFAHAAGDKVYLGLAGDDQLTVLPDASGRAILVGGSGDDYYEVRSTEAVIVKDSGGGDDTLNWLAANGSSQNYTVDNRILVQETDRTFSGDIMTSWIGDLRASEDVIEAIGQGESAIELGLGQEQFIDFLSQYQSWKGNKPAGDVGLDGYQEDLTAIAGLNAQYEDAM